MDACVLLWCRIYSQGFLFIDAKRTSVIIMALLMSIEKEWRLLGHKPAALHATGIAGPARDRLVWFQCHMSCLSRMMHVRLMGYTRKKEKQQLDMNVCVQTNESKARCVCGKMTGGGEIIPLLFFYLSWPRVWVLQCEAETHRWAAVSLSVAPLTLSLSVCYSQFNSYEFSSG